MYRQFLCAILLLLLLLCYCYYYCLFVGLIFACRWGSNTWPHEWSGHIIYLIVVHIQPPVLAPAISQQVMSPATLGCIISLTTIHRPLLALIALQNILGQHLCWDNLNHLCLRLSTCSNWQGTSVSVSYIYIADRYSNYCTCNTHDATKGTSAHHKCPLALWWVTTPYYGPLGHSEPRGIWGLGWASPLPEIHTLHSSLPLSGYFPLATDAFPGTFDGSNTPASATYTRVETMQAITEYPMLRERELMDMSTPQSDRLELERRHYPICVTSHQYPL